MPRDGDGADDRSLALGDVPIYMTELAREGNKMVPLVSFLALECLTTSSAHVYFVVKEGKRWILYQVMMDCKRFEDNIDQGTTLTCLSSTNPVTRFR